jgi:hypothetical protein
MPTRDPFCTCRRPRVRFVLARRARSGDRRPADCLRSSRRPHRRTASPFRVCSQGLGLAVRTTAQVAIIVVRQVFQRIWNALDWLAAAMVAGLHLLAKSWLKGVTAYGLAMHGYVPDSNLYAYSHFVDDEKESAHEPDGPLSSCAISHAEVVEASSSWSSAAVFTITAVGGTGRRRRAVAAALWPRLPALRRSPVIGNAVLTRARHLVLRLQHLGRNLKSYCYLAASSSLTKRGGRKR